MNCSFCSNLLSQPFFLLLEMKQPESWIYAVFSLCTELLVSAGNILASYISDIRTEESVFEIYDLAFAPTV